MGLARALLCRSSRGDEADPGRTARKKKRHKHGGEHVRADLLEHDLRVDSADNEVLAVDDAMHRLSLEDPLAAEVLKLKYYGGLSVDEAAVALGVPRATAYRHWTYARAWVRAEFNDEKSEKNRADS